MRRYLLLGQGDFIRHLMDLLEWVVWVSFCVNVCANIFACISVCMIVAMRMCVPFTVIKESVLFFIRSFESVNDFLCVPQIREDLAKPAGNLYLHNLNGILETAIRATNAQYDDADILKRLDVRLLEVISLRLQLKWMEGSVRLHCICVCVCWPCCGPFGLAFTWWGCCGLFLT